MVVLVQSDGLDSSWLIPEWATWEMQVEVYGIFMICLKITYHLFYPNLLVKVVTKGSPVSQEEDIAKGKF
jgi:hypothetical protein